MITSRKRSLSAQLHVWKDIPILLLKICLLKLFKMLKYKRLLIIPHQISKVYWMSFLKSRKLWLPTLSAKITVKMWRVAVISGHHLTNRSEKQRPMIQKETKALEARLLKSPTDLHKEFLCYQLKKCQKSTLKLLLTA